VTKSVFPQREALLNNVLVMQDQFWFDPQPAVEAAKICQV
jgi:hypothetical protein